MQSFVIEGGRPLSGTVRAAGNKNGALPILAATVLASEPVVLSNVPRIRDVETMVELLVDLGASAEWTGPNDVTIDATSVTKTALDADLGREIRASFLLAGPLLARFGRATVPPPGGDVIGRRRLDTHIHAFMELGVEVELNGAYDLRTDGLKGRRMFLDEASVMATENAVMAAVLAEGDTIVGHAACEPHIQDLCHFLVSLGARIDGIGSNILRITGVERLGGGGHRIRPEHVEVASFAALAAATGGDVTIEDVEPDDLISIVPAFRKLGIALDVGDTTVRVPPGQELQVVDDLGDQIPKIEWDLAGVPGRSDLDRRRRSDTGARHRAGVREDVREPPLLRRQARLDGSQDHPLRPAPRRRHRPRSALWPAPGEPGHPRRDGHGDCRSVRGGSVDDRQHRPDRPRLRAHRRSAAGARGVDRARRAVSGARIADGTGVANVSTGVPVLDHLLGELARAAGFDLALEIDPDDPEAEVDAAGTALGRAVAPRLAPGAHGEATVPADEALAMVVVERSERPLVASNADLTGAGGLGTDLAARFLGRLAEEAGLTVHVRLMEGEDTGHALAAIFKALGVALARAGEPAR